MKLSSNGGLEPCLDPNRRFENLSLLYNSKITEIRYITIYVLHVKPPVSFILSQIVLVQWLACLTFNQPAVSLNLIKGSCCFIEQEYLPPIA